MPALRCSGYRLEIGFRNRVTVFFEWAWTYFTFTHGARLITGSQELPGWSEQQGVQMAANATPLDPTSPGFRDLRWIKPVMAGDTVTFVSEVESKRTSNSRPEWGIVQVRNTGTNQRGEVVFSFLGGGFVPRRNAGTEK